MKVLRFYFLVIIVSFGLHFVWESLHISLYTGYGGIETYGLPVTLWATFGDVLYTLGVVLVIALVHRSLLWCERLRFTEYVFLGFFGFIISLCIEYKALAIMKWHYLPTMPLIPIFNVGLSPVLQMTMLLPLSVAISVFVHKQIG